MNVGDVISTILIMVAPVLPVKNGTLVDRVTLRKKISSNLQILASPVRTS